MSEYLKIPKDFSSMSAKEALESLRAEFLSPKEIRQHQALSSILETLKDVEVAQADTGGGT